MAEECNSPLQGTFELAQVAACQQEDENHSDEQQNEQKEDINIGQPVDEYMKEKLIAQAKEFSDLYQEFEQNRNSIQLQEYCYILSMKWFNKWKQYVSYDEVINNLEVLPSFGQNPPGRCNKDLIAQKIEDNQEYLQVQQYYKWRGGNYVLKNNLTFQKDYIIVDENIMNFFENKFEAEFIERKQVQLPNGQIIVDIQLKQLTIIPICYPILYQIDTGKINYLPKKKFQISNFEKLDECKQRLQEIFNLIFQYDPEYQFYQFNKYISQELMRIWKLKTDSSSEDLFNNLSIVCQASPNYDYQLGIQNINQIKNDLEFEQLTESDLILLEIRQHNKNWYFTKDQQDDQILQCGYCQNFGQFSLKCHCFKVVYCSVECEINNRPIHSQVCTAFQSSQTMINNSASASVYPSNSIKGLCGLANLGNTCFMNSALQGLSHTFALTKYFLNKLHQNEINLINPLGSQGQIVQQYASLIYNLWGCPNQFYVPFEFKIAIEQFQPMFAGHQQHDASELLSFLLDGIHEDLNRVKQKQYSIIKDNDNIKEDELAKQSWLNHIKRNQSIIVDLFQGQIRSQITCSVCQKKSVTFDTYMTCQLPIPKKSIKIIEFYFIFVDNRTTPLLIKIKFAPNSNHNVHQLKLDTASLLQEAGYSVDPQNIIFAFLTYHSLREVLKDDHPTKEARKSSQMQRLFAIEKSKEDQQIDKNLCIQVLVQMSQMQYLSRYNPQQLIKKNFTFARLFHFSLSDAISTVHKKVFSYFRFLWEQQLPDQNQKLKLVNLDLDQAYNQIILSDKHPPYRILILTNANGFNQCFFCGNPNCQNCELPYNDDTLVMDVVNKIQDSKFEFILQVFWDSKPSFIDLQVLNNYNDLKIPEKTINKDLSQKQGSSSSLDNSLVSHDQSQINSLEKQTTIYDCFKLFNVEEDLNEDNQWYCPSCGKHQNAKKKLQLYNSPIYLIIQLKRFRVKDGIINNKINERIVFPVQNLELHKFIIKSEYPSDYYQDKQYFQDILIPTEYDYKKLLNIDSQQQFTKNTSYSEENKEQYIEHNKFDIQSQKINKKLNISNNQSSIDAQNQQEQEENKTSEDSNQIQSAGVVQQQEINKPNQQIIYDQLNTEQQQKITVNQQQPIKKIHYNLFATINHMGNLGYGHYTAYCLNPFKQQWFHFDDSSVFPIKEEQVCNDNNYILFYKRSE